MYPLLDRADTMRVEWVREQLKRFTYKPGWRFTVFAHFLMPQFVIRFKCEDTYNPGKSIEVGKATPLRFVPIGDEKAFAEWLAHEVKDVEIHESREWLKRDGKIFDDPHARS